MRDILVNASNYNTWSFGVEYAARLAAAQQAVLTGAYVYPAPQYTMPAYGASALLTTIVECNRKIEQQAVAAEKHFVDWANAHGVDQAAWQVVEGFLPEALAQIGNWHDVLILERNSEVAWESPGDLGSLVLHVGLPCIVVPPGAPDPTKLECVAIAWNGAPEALRAIHAARPLLVRAKRVVLLNGHRRDPLSEIGWRPAFDILMYLKRHGVHAQLRQVTAADADAGEALLGASAAIDADLLVMGAYGRNRFSEWMFGGATRHVLSHARLPVLMYH